MESARDRGALWRRSPMTRFTGAHSANTRRAPLHINRYERELSFKGSAARVVSGLSLFIRGTPRWRVEGTKGWEVCLALPGQPGGLFDCFCTLQWHRLVARDRETDVSSSSTLERSNFRLARD